MKIRYKFFIAFTIIVAITVPVPVYILNRQIQQQHQNIISQGTVHTKLLSHAVLNMLLLNNGNVPQTSIDASEYVNNLTSQLANGLVSIKVVLLTPNSHYNGTLLVDIPDGKTLTKISEQLFQRIQNQETVVSTSVNNISLVEFTVRTHLENSPIACVTHIVCNKSVILKPVYNNYKVFFISIASIIIIAYLVALGFSYRFARPVESIIKALQKFDEGTTSIKIPVTAHKDEIGKLAVTTQHLLDMVNLEIKELTRTNLELVRLNKLKDDFLANISHEFKIPLESITLLANSIIHNYSDADSLENTTSLEMIANSSLRLSYMIDDILDFTRLKNNDITLNTKLVDISGVVNFVISILQPAIRTKSLSIEIHIDPGATHIIADEVRLQQIFLNIIGNAVKYSQKGTISIRTQKDKDNTVSIIVQDNAGGFPEILLHTINDYQYDSIQDEALGGLRLGLFITKKLVELHNGTIIIESLPDKGTTVILSFPCDELPVNKEISPIPPRSEFTLQQSSTHELNNLSARDTTRGFIYIVDDDPVNVKVLYDILTGAGYFVQCSHEDSPLYSMIHKGLLPDIVLLDTILPGTSAFEVCQKIRKQYSLHELPIMIITSKHHTQEIITAYRIGANDYLSKPFNKDELLAKITNLITLKKSIEEHNEFIKLKHEIQLAHEIHNSVVIQDIPELDNIHIAHAYIPTREMGGDFYDVITLDNDKAGIIIADVTGHGIPAAIVCAMLKMAFLNNKHLALHPAQLLTMLNKDLYNNIKENYITAAYALIDTKNKTLKVSSAGHWPPLLIKKQGSLFNTWPKGFPIGWVDNGIYKEAGIHYESGDKILLYTDGIIEAKNPNNKIFGFESLLDYCIHNHLKDPESFANGLIQSLFIWGDIDSSSSFSDDVTLIIAELL